MRVIAGSAGGLRLKTRKSDATRPTLDRVRETLFSILGERVVDSVFVDLFAGTGAVGIEALSRGGKYAIFVETNPACVELIKQNLETTGLAGRASIFKGSVNTALNWLEERGEAVDLFFCDPPYERGLVVKTLERFGKHPGLLALNGLVVTQQDAKEPSCSPGGNLCLVRQRRVGSTRLDFYRCRSAGGEKESYPSDRSPLLQEESSCA